MKTLLLAAILQQTATQPPLALVQPEPPAAAPVVGAVVDRDGADELARVGRHDDDALPGLERQPRRHEDQEVLGEHEPRFEREEGSEWLAEVDRAPQDVDRTSAPEARRVRLGQEEAYTVVRRAPALVEPFAGAEYKDSFALADVETNDTLPADELQLCPSEFGPVAIFPMSATRRRIVATADNPVGDAPSLELVQRALRLRAPAGLEARSLHWSSYFRIHHRQTAQLRVGRIFLAGDAAHIHSPFGGQG
jgi:hypothetical protein